MTIVTVVIFLSEVEMTIWNLEQCHQAMLLEILVLKHFTSVDSNNS